MENNNEFKDYKIFYTDCRHGNLEAVKRHYLNGADLSFNNNQALIIAASSGQLLIVQYLVSMGVNIGANFYQAIKCASKYGHLLVVQYLMLKMENNDTNNDKNNDTNNYTNNQVFKIACGGGHIHIVKYMIDKGINIDAIGQDSIELAKKYGQQHLVDYLTKIIFETPMTDNDSKQNIL